MPKDVSSPLTFINKFISPPAFLGMIIFFYYNWYLMNMPLFGSWAISAALLLVVLFLIVIPAMKVKKVAYDNNYLYVSNYFKEIQVPLSEVADVSQSFWQKGKSERVSITFKEPTEFGTKIFFYPTIRFWGVDEHPVVNELKYIIGNYYNDLSRQFPRFS